LFSKRIDLRQAGNIIQDFFTQKKSSDFHSGIQNPAGIDEKLRVIRKLSIAQFVRTRRNPMDSSGT